MKGSAAVPISSAGSARRGAKLGRVRRAAEGSARDLLVAMRDTIADEIDSGVAARDLAALTRRLLEVSREIEALDSAEEVDGVADAAATPDEPWSG